MSQSDEWAHRTPRGKRVPEAEINNSQEQQSSRKQPTNKSAGQTQK
ncbi:hypothetical protein ACSVDE_11805 [Pseudalkalibacillus sp. Hm43]